jgi:hypothetical protein
MTFPRQEKFLDRNGVTENPIFEPSQNASLIPKKIVRNFDLPSQIKSSKSALFESKRTELENRLKLDETLHTSEIKVSLQDVKKQFIEE